MNWIIKILSLLIFALVGGILFSITTNIIIVSSLLDVQSVTDNFGQDMTHKAVIIWSISVLVGVISLFIEQKWRYIFTLMPLYMPSLFVLIYSMSH